MWHTQGAGKSLEMTCLAGKLITEPRLENPTLLMVTDRQDLDGSLFDTFNDSGSLLSETPKRAESRQDLREHLNDRPSGGIIFTPFSLFLLNEGDQVVISKVAGDRLFGRVRIYLDKQGIYRNISGWILGKHLNRME